MDASRLKSIPLFEDVPDEELGQIATFAQEVTVDEGRELVREGDFSYEFMSSAATASITTIAWKRRSICFPAMTVQPCKTGPGNM